MNELPPEIEKKLMEFQSVQEQLQMIASQRMQFKMQQDETEAALTELKTAKGRVFKSAGMIIIESDKDALTKELEEKKETLGVRFQAVSKQEDKLRKQLLDLRSELETAAKAQAAKK